MLAASLCLGALGSVLVDAGSASAGGPGIVPWNTTPGAVTFPTTPVGSSNTQTLTFTDDGVFGSPSEDLSNPVFSPADTEFASDQLCTNGSFTFSFFTPTCVENIVYTPTHVGFASTVGTFTDSSGDFFSVTFSGIGAGPILTANPNPVNFGATNTPGPFPSGNDMTITITNVGDGPADFTAAPVVGGANPGNFEIVGADTCATAVLNTNDTCQVTVEFADTTAGQSLTANITFTPSNDTGQAITVPLSGGTLTPPPPPPGPTTLTPPTLSFGNVAVGSPSSVETLTLTNTNPTVNSVYSGYAITGNADFIDTLTGTCHPGGGTLAPHGTCTINLEFVPSASGPENATVTVSFSDGQPSVSSLLTGNGVAPSYEITAGPVHFGDVEVDQSSPVTDVTVTNNGSVALFLGTATVSDTADFAVSPGPTCSGIFLPGATCILALNFDPGSAGSKAGALNVPVSNSTDTVHYTPLNVGMDGTGIQQYFSVTPDFNFDTLSPGGTAVGTSSPEQVFTVTDLDGSITFGPSSIGGPDATSFPLVTDGCNTKTLVFSQTCQITVVFTPLDTGPLSAQLLVTATSPAIPPVAVPLTGTGLPGTTASVAPNPVNFGAIQIGHSSIQQFVNVTNTGSTPLVFSGPLTVLGADAADFPIVAPGCVMGTPVAPGGTCTIALVFTPMAGPGTGPVSATLVIDDNASGHPQNVLLEGDALPQPLNGLVATPSNLVFGSIGLGITSAAQQVTVTNTSLTTPVTLGTISQGGANPADFGIASLPNSNTCVTGLMLNPADTCTFTETFKPTILGAESAQVLLPFGGATPPDTLVVPLSGVGVPDTTLTIAPNPLAFGSQLVGTASGLETVTVTNTGPNPAIFPAGTPALSGPGSGDYVIVSDTCNGNTVASGGTCAYTVEFLPTATAVGTDDADFLVADNALGSPQTVNLTGTGLAQPAGGAVTAVPAALDFGSVGIGIESAAQTDTITNGTAVPVTIGTVTNSGVNKLDFGNGAGGPATDNCSAVILSPGSSCTVTEDFKPTLLGIESASLNVPYTGGTLSVPLSGVGIAAVTDTIAPNPLVFATPQQAGTVSGIESVTVTNSGPGPLLVTGVTAGAGPDQSDFVVVGDSCIGATIPSGATCQLFLDFAPATAKGSEAGSFTFVDNATGSQVLVVTGTSVPQPVGGAVTVSPNPFNFGNEAVGTRTFPQTFTVDNGSAATITFPTAPSNVGANAADFGILSAPDSNGCTGPINPGATCILTESFKPSFIGFESTSLEIPYSGGTLDVLLTGTGVAVGSSITVNPNPLNFGNEQVGTVSTALPETITNTGPNPVPVTSVTISGADSSQFIIQNPGTCVTTLNPGNSCEVDVTFAPVAPVGSGARSASLVFIAGGAPYDVLLEGTATAAAPNGGLTIAPNPVNFGAIGVGVSSFDMTVTVTNNSTTAAAALNTVFKTGAQAGAFTIDADSCSNTSLGIAGSGSNTCTIEVHFTPTIVGLESAVLTVPEAGGGSISTVLEGQGVPAASDTIVPSTLNFGNIVQGAVSTDQIITITNTDGTNPLTVNSVTLSGAQPADFMVVSDACTSGVIYPGLSCQIAVVFTPQANVSPNEDVSATLLISDSADGAQQLVNLLGQTEAHAVSYSLTTLPASSLTNPFLNFGPQAVGTVSPPQIITVTNTAHGDPSNPENLDQALVFPATGDVTLASVTAGGTSQFRIVNDLCKGDIVDPPGTNTTDTCTVDVEFAPTAPNGPVFDFLDFNPTNGSSQAFQVELIGDGIQPGSLSLGLAANGLNFGEQIINTTSASQQIVIQNTSATANLVLTGISLVGTNASDFAILPIPGNCGFSFPVVVQIGASCSLTVDFTPSALGPRSALVNIVDNTPESPDTVLLTGVGIPRIPEQGYWLVGSDGGVFAFGAAHYFGSLGNLVLNKPIVGMAATPDGNGYWLVASDGGIFTFGDAQYYGSTGGLRLNKPIVGMAATPDGRGYWLVATDGGIFSFGDAQFYGSTGSLKLNKPIVAMTKTPDGMGYLLVATDGGVFCFGDAEFHGSAANYNLNQPINGLVVTPVTPTDPANPNPPAGDTDGGYLLSAADGGLFAFGNAAFMGSAASLNLKEPVIGIMSTPDFGGYWQVANDGGVFSFGDAQFHGSIGDTVIITPNIVGLASDPVSGFET